MTPASQTQDQLRILITGVKSHFSTAAGSTALKQFILQLTTFLPNSNSAKQPEHGN